MHTYVIELLEDWEISKTFDVADLDNYQRKDEVYISIIEGVMRNKVKFHFLLFLLVLYCLYKLVLARYPWIINKECLSLRNI